MREGPSITAFVLFSIESLPEEFKKRYQKNLRKAYEYLKKQIDPEGAIGTLPEIPDYPTYATSFAIAAFCVGKPPGWEREVEKMVRYLKVAQLTERRGWSREDKEYGGWDFGGKLWKKPRTFHLDLSITSFALEALNLAGLSREDPLWQKALIFVRRCQNFPRDGGFFFTPAPTEGNGNKAGYTRIDGRVRPRSYGSMTCDGIRSLLACGTPKNEIRVQKAFNWLRKNFTLAKTPGFPKDMEVPWDIGVRFYYYASLALAMEKLGIRSLEKKGKKIFWAKELARRLIKLQNQDGSWKNSSYLMREDDPLIATPLSLIALGVIARIL